jgi:hypothetical protein
MSGTPETFRIEFSAVELLREIVHKYGAQDAEMIWEQAEADAVDAGEDCISYERLDRTLREYLAEVAAHDATREAGGDE